MAPVTSQSVDSVDERATHEAPDLTTVPPNDSTALIFDAIAFAGMTAQTGIEISFDVASAAAAATNALA